MFFKKKNEVASESYDPNSFVSVIRHIPLSPVDLAGEFLDLSTLWRRSRRWSAVLAILPVFLVTTVVASFVIAGKVVSDGVKVERYAERANDELEKIEAEKDNKESSDKQGTESSKRMPELVDMLFRRVLQLNQNNKLAKFYVANQMARYGSKASARQIMEGLAPLQTTGYPKAHAWLAMDILERSQKGESVNVETLKYHLKRGTVGERVPPALYLAYSQLLQQDKPTEAQQYLKKAAESDSKLLLNSVRSYLQNGQSAQAAAAADTLIEKVKDKTDNPEESLVLVAQAFAMTDRIDRALEVLQNGFKKYPQSTIVARALSDAYRLKFRTTAVRNNNQVQVNLEFLNAAIAFDPTNVTIQEEFNLLAQLGIGQTDATIEALRVQIATSGTSFAARLLLADSAQRRGDFVSAINDHEVILAELPRMTLSLNKLAALLTQTTPPRLDEALKLIDRAIEISPSVPELYDTKGDVLVASKKKDEAIQCYLTALEKAPQLVYTREKLIGLYEELSQSEQAQLQRVKLAEVQKAIDLQMERIKEAQEQARIRAEAEAKKSDAVNPETPSTDGSNAESAPADSAPAEAANSDSNSQAKDPSGN